MSGGRKSPGGAVEAVEVVCTTRAEYEPLVRSVSALGLKRVVCLDVSDDLDAGDKAQADHLSERLTKSCKR